MKLIEKLARDWDLDNSQAYDPNPTAAFEAGFRKALELAARSVIEDAIVFRNSTGMEVRFTDIGLEGQSLKKHIARNIRRIGEKEEGG
jgi:hypothetical protein